MPSFFTHYWQKKNFGAQNAKLLKAYSGQFAARRVRVGDTVFFVSYQNQGPILVGSITVAECLPKNEKHWNRIKANSNDAVIQSERTIPIKIARQITRYKTGEGWKIENGILKPQTLRGVQRITEYSAELLKSLLQ